MVISLHYFSTGVEATMPTVLLVGIMQSEEESVVAATQACAAASVELALVVIFLIACPGPPHPYPLVVDRNSSICKLRG